MVLIQLVRIYRRIRQQRALGLGLVVGLGMVCILGNAICFYLCEGGGEGPTFGDAVWYSVISITTIGYGDYSASTAGARLGTIVFIVLLGLATFSMFLGIVIDGVTDLARRELRGMNQVLAQNHILVVNFPSESRVQQLIRELQSDPTHQGREIVIISDKLEQLPFQHPHVLFVRGSVLERETYRRARVSDAKMAIVLATSYEDENSDAIVASAIAVIDSLVPEIHIVAECLNPRHRLLFDAVHCDAIVYSLQISGNLLAQEVHDPGISQLIGAMTSNTQGCTLFSIDVPAGDSVRYNELAKNLLDCDVHLVSVNRAERCLTAFREVVSEPGDRVIYVAGRRLEWAELKEAAHVG